MVGTTLRPRFIQGRLAEALEDSPAVLIQGPRQCGKTTLAQLVCAPDCLPGLPETFSPAVGGYSYFSFDDDVIRGGAESDPMGFIADLPERVVIDEVQRVPGLFTSLKLEIDRRRMPGRFVLTGSTNVLAIPTVQDSLAGRLETVRLHPLAQCELYADRPSDTGFIRLLVRRPFPNERDRKDGWQPCQADCVRGLSSGTCPSRRAEADHLVPELPRGPGATGYRLAFPNQQPGCPAQAACPGRDPDSPSCSI